MARITSIEPQKRDPERMNIQLDGQYAFSLAGVLAARLTVGQVLQPPEVASLIEDETRQQAFQLALGFLSYRQRSEAEIRQYLRKHKVPADVLDQTLDRLRAHRLADDEKFAAAWVENRNVFRPRSRRALTWELRQKGVQPEALETAVADLDEPALAYQAGQKKARALAPLAWPEFRTKLYAFLARRGFPASIIAPVVSQLWQETHAGQPNTDNEDIS